MNVKKITSMIAIALVVATGSSSFGQAVYAAENSNVSATASVTKNANINANTIITNDNIKEVLKYVGLNPNDLVRGNETGGSIKTVGELQKVIKQVQNNKINVKTKANTTNTTTKNSKLITASYSDDDSPIDSQRVYHDLDETDYSVEFSCDGEYTHGQWYSVSGEDAQLTNAGSPSYSYAITSKKDLSATFTSDRITMHHDIMVTGYVTVIGYSVPATKVEIKGYDYFNIDDWV